MEKLYINSLGFELTMTPARARALLWEVTNWLALKAQIAVDCEPRNEPEEDETDE